MTAGVGAESIAALEGAVPFTPIITHCAQEACRVDVYNNVVALQHQWIGLEQQCSGNLFQSFAWCAAWVDASRAVGREEKLRIVTVWEGENLKLLWPLVIQNVGPFRILTSLGDPATQYCDVLIAQGAARERWLETAWNRIITLEGTDAVLLRGLRSDAAIAHILEAKGRAFTTRSAYAPFLDFGTDPSPDCAYRRSSRTRNALRRHLRKLSIEGPVEFEIVDGRAERITAMAELIGLKRAWLSQKSRLSAGYAHPANDAFLFAIAAMDNCIIAQVRVGGDVAAVEAGAVQDGRYYSLVQSYRLRYATHGPGQLAISYIVDQASHLGIRIIDFLAPAYRHKSDWATGEVLTVEYVIPIRPAGQLALVYLKYVRPRAKVLVEGALRGIQALQRHFR